MEDERNFKSELLLEISNDYSKSVVNDGNVLFIYGVLRGVVENDLEQVKYFTQLGGDVNVTDGNGNTPLHVAIIKNNSEIVDYLLSEKNLDIDIRNFNGETPLFIAIKNENLPLAQLLILTGANVNIPNYEDVTPLHLSVKHPFLVHLLIRHGAYLDAVDYSGDTPLHDATAEECLETVCMLLYYNADANICGVNNLTPFMKSLISKNINIQEVLINYVTDFNIETYDHITVLALALINKSPFVEEIINGGADVNYAYGYDLIDAFSLCLQYPDANNFKTVWNKLKYDGDDMSLGSILWRISGTLRKEHFKQYVDVIIESDNFEQVVNSVTTADDYYMVIVRFCDFFHQLSLDQLTVLTCCLLSNGYVPTSFDMSKVFLHYGYCELFKILLHMDIRYIGQRPPDMSRIIYDPCTKMKTLLNQIVSVIEIAYLHNTVYQLLDYCIYPKLMRAYLDLNRDDYVTFKILHLPIVPSLLELCRNKAREYLIDTFRINDSKKLYTLINYLDIPCVYKKILTFERILYRPEYKIVNNFK